MVHLKRPDNVIRYGDKYDMTKREKEREKNFKVFQILILLNTS